MATRAKEKRATHLGRQTPMAASGQEIPPPLVRPLAFARVALPVLLVAVTAGFARTALAHKIHVFATVEGEEVRGEVYAPGGAAIVGATVTATDPAGRRLGQTTTDAEGRFQFTPRVRCDWRLVADAGEGHIAEYTVPGEEFPQSLPGGTPGRQPAAALPPSPPATAPRENARPPDEGALPAEIVERIGGVERQLTALRKELDQQRNQLRFGDVVGGVGYILGMGGVAFYFLGLRRTGDE